MNKNQLLARLTILTLLVMLLSACGGAMTATPAEVTAPTSACGRSRCTLPNIDGSGAVSG